VVVTSRQLAAAATACGDLSAAAAAVQVETAAGTLMAPVAEVRAAGEVAALRLSGRGEGMVLRGGFSALVRVGDVICSVPPAEPGDQPTVGSGVIERFRPFPEPGMSVFEIAMDLPESQVGGPLFNELGEVVAVITSARRPGAVAGRGAATFAA